ncbi:MAG: Dam family site-specific DNA-(adenine-N6)-methyltransferase [Anaerolineae bacterium]|nr:Dam family site-specific DNA-(adenine-N6)-methyltransferase [Anaerolineae bacterium]
MIIVPPIKCQGIKTRLVSSIRAHLPEGDFVRWIEPFCGSGVVALNVQPARAILADKNRHIIALYRAIQQKSITPGVVREYLQQSGERLQQDGQDFYNVVRNRFNTTGDSLDFLFLNRACFNGVMRFNRRGEFNVPFGHKPERFRPAYVTKIANQVGRFQDVVTRLDWRFDVADFRETIAKATADDFLYIDPPYAGRHSDYFTAWNEQDERDLVEALQKTPARFLLSTWHHNQYRSNPSIEEHWQRAPFHTRLFKHFYHVGPTEARRGEMTEALISNYRFPALAESDPVYHQISLFGD